MCTPVSDQIASRTSELLLVCDLDRNHLVWALRRIVGPVEFPPNLDERIVESGPSGSKLPWASRSRAPNITHPSE